MPDEPTCRRLLDPKDSDTRYAMDAVAAGRLAYDPVRAARCLVETEDAPCPVFPFGGEECRAVFTGLVEEGARCVSAAECAGGGACEEATCDGACCVGICGPEPDPVPPPMEVGEPCVTHTDCVPTAYCELDRVCTPLPDEPGEPCLFGCAFGDLYCDLDTLTCGLYAGPGEPCDAVTRCDPAWAFCDGVCRPRPGEGEACDDDARRCIATTFCDAGLCAALGRPGDPCEADGQCGDLCDETAGTCVAYAACP